MERYDTVPKKDGFQMPAEYEPHDGCWMLWPQRPDNWRLGAKPAQKAFVRLAQAIIKYEPLTVGVNQDQYQNALAMLPPEVRVVEMASNDAWARDCGPVFVKNRETGEVRGIDWRFNAWGGLFDGLYFPWDLDDQVARKICDMEYLDRYPMENFILEGSSICTDGEGTILTTEECLLAEGRNHNLTKEEITEVLCNYLGADKVIWLKNGLYLDETNGILDKMCCFAEPGKVLLAWTDDQKDPQYQLSLENLEILEQEKDAQGRPFEVIKVPLPEPIFISEEDADGIDIVKGTYPRNKGDRLCASYIGFYIANGGLIVPRFGDPKDVEAVEILQGCFPDREITTVDAREIVLGGGNIHAITLQQPYIGFPEADEIAIDLDMLAAAQTEGEQDA